MKVEVDVLGFPGVRNSPYGLCGRKATLKLTLAFNGVVGITSLGLSQRPTCL